MQRDASNRQSSLIRRITIFTTFIVLLSFSGLCFIIDRQQSRYIENEISVTMKLVGGSTSNNIANWFEGRGILLEYLANNIGQNLSSIMDRLNNKILEEQFSSVYFGHSNGIFMIWPPNNSIPAGYDPRTRHWYQDAVREQGLVLIPPYTSGTGDVVLSIAMPIAAGDQVAGVLGADLPLSTLVEWVKTITVGGLGHAFIVDNAGTIIIHPDSDLIGKKFEDVFSSPLPGERMAEMSHNGRDWLISTYAINNLPGVDWRIAAAIDPDLAFASLTEFRRTALIVVLGAILLSTVLLAVLLNRGISKPLDRIIVAMKTLAAGNLDIAIPGRDRNDEIGAVASALEVFKQTAVERRQLEDKQKQVNEAQALRMQTMDRLIGEFDGEIARALQLIRTSSGVLENTARSLNATADTGAAGIVSISAAAEEASANVNNVASASEELSASIGEISRQIEDSRKIAEQAAASVLATDDAAQQLVTASEHITAIVSLISSIAEQTNLLALNATIEAARAGEAGRGFAVVATEVKSLADQTARATGDISEHIRAIQSTSNTAVTAIRDVGKIIEKIGMVFSQIASAVSQQGSATREIAENVQNAATGTQQVSARLHEISASTNNTRNHATSVLDSAAGQTREADGLRQRIEGFLTDIRAA